MEKSVFICITKSLPFGYMSIVDDIPGFTLLIHRAQMFDSRKTAQDFLDDFINYDVNYHFLKEYEVQEFTLKSKH